MRELHDGVIATFDEAGGFGTLTHRVGGTERWFHCTAIADGSRSIQVGAPVTFTLVPGATRQWEAGDLRRMHCRPATVIGDP
jgi:cold shock CspA family protein